MGLLLWRGGRHGLEARLRKQVFRLPGGRGGGAAGDECHEGRDAKDDEQICNVFHSFGFGLAEEKAE
jgi:hypothetical protein